MTKYEKGELAKKILFAAVGVAAVGTVMVLPGMAILLKMFNVDGARNRERFRRAIKRMEERKIVSRRIKNGKEEFVVTKYGKTHIDKYLVSDLQIPLAKRWDGKWRVIMFDIPEKNKGGRVRRDVSQQLRNIGMKAIQNSVFVSPFPCKEQIDTVINFFKVKQHFVYFEAETYEGVEDLLNFFKLTKLR
jgi:DNA-binding transcriptional regulator PaaX